MSVRTRVDGPAGRIWVDDGGPPGTLPVVIVPSLAASAAQWREQLEALRRERRAVLVEVRGHGGSDRPSDGDYSPEAMAADVAAAVDGLGLERFVLVGHSMGASVALAYASAHPDRVAGLLLVDPNGDARRVPREEIERFLERLDSDAYPDVIMEHYDAALGPSTARVRERVLAELARMPREVVVPIFREMIAFDPLSALARYPGPRLVVFSPVTDTPVGLHRLVPELPHRRVEGAGHWLHLDQPEEFQRILAEFLAQL
ncbi:MAG: alpha/beta hydrolase [Gemmatimonadetes bacterium]|nr:alpha/beta hydrolase [Gemmatimonadota bacterium]